MNKHKNCSCMLCRFGAVGVAPVDKLSAAPKAPDGNLTSNKGNLTRPNGNLTGNLTKQARYRLAHKKEHAEYMRSYMRKRRGVLV